MEVRGKYYIIFEDIVWLLLRNSQGNIFVGEADADLLFRTVTNPKYRKLLQIDINDTDEANRIFELLHGKSAKLREARRELIDNTKLSYADIDN